MERKLAHIEKVVDIQPIPGADRIETLSILGWKVVANKGDFKVGDLCCYLEIDSVVQEKPEFEFLRKSHFRIKTVRLKKQISQGICFSLSILPEPQRTQMQQANPDDLVGLDVTEMLGISKYEPYIPAQLAGTVKGSFPAFLHKTDEERIQSCPDVLERHKGTVFAVSEKIDGTSFTAFLYNGTFGVCSRNLELKEDETNTYWKVARELKLKECLEKLGGNWALQGELIGQGIQKNKYVLPGVELRLFNIFNIDEGKYLDQDEFTRKAEFLGLKTVPILMQLPLDHTVDQLVELSKGNSVVNPKSQREGLIFRPEHEQYDEELGRLSFKVINPEFLLHYSE